MTADCLEVRIEDHVAEVRLNRPEAANALHPPFWTAFPEIFERLSSDPRVRVVVITAEGTHFSAGIDLEFLTSLVPDPALEPARGRDQLRRRIIGLQAAFKAVADCRVPVLAAIQGACLGGGLDLVAACDMRYASSGAYFCIQEVNIGIVADLGSLQRLPLQLPAGLLRELAFTGRKLPAAEALEAGFVNAVLENPQALHGHVMDIARQIASRSPLAVTGTKEMLARPSRAAIEDGLRFVAAWNAAEMSIEDVARGAKAALARTQVRFDDLSD